MQDVGAAAPPTIIQEDEGSRCLDKRPGRPAISNFLSTIRDTAAFAEASDNFMSPTDDLFVPPFDHFM